MSTIKSKHLFLFSCAVLIFGLLWSRFMISLGMIFLLFTAFYEGDIKEMFVHFFKNKAYLALTGIFFLFLATGLWTDNQEYFIQRMTLKLPFFFLPFAFSAMPKMDRRTIISVFYIFIAVCLTGVLWSMGLFLTDLNHYIDIYSKGQILPTPVHHIRFSIMIAIAIAMAVYLIFKNEYRVYKKERYILIGIALFFALYLHLLAVRSGLMTFYVFILCTLFFTLKSKVNKKMGLAISAFAIVVVTFSFLFVPTVKNKVGYMRYSLRQFAKNENIRDLSDSRRLGSIFAGIDLGKKNPLLGVGYGDLKDETNAYLKKHYPDLQDLDLLPHNQYILVLATAGVIGMLLFILFTTLPFFYQMAYKDFFFVSIQLMFISSFIVEHTIEAQIGTAIYIFIVLLAMKNIESINLE